MVYVQFVGCCMLFILGFSVIDKSILSVEIAKKLYSV